MTGDPAIESGAVEEFCEFGKVRYRRVGRWHVPGPLSAVSIDPGRTQAGLACAMNVGFRVIADMQNPVGCYARPFDREIEDPAGRFRRAGLYSRNDAVKQVPNANCLEVGVAVGNGNHGVARIEPFEMSNAGSTSASS